MIHGFFENSLHASVIFKPDLAVVAFNKRAQQRFLTQLNKEITIGSSILDFVPRGLEQESMDDLREVMKGREFNKFTYIEHLNSPRWIKYNYVPVIAPETSRVEYICLNIFALDQSPEDQGENQYSILLFRKIFESSADGCIVIEYKPDQSTEFVECNLRALEILGFRSQLELSNHWGKFHLTPYNKEKLNELFSSLNDDARYSDEFLLEQFRGGSVFVSFRIFQFNFRGKRYHIINLSDINRLKEHELKLKEQDELFSFISKATQDGLYNYDLKNNRIWVSNEYLKMIGNADEARDHHIEWFLQRVHPEDRAQVDSNLKELTEGHLSHMKLEYRFRHVEGYYLYLIDRGFILRDQRGVVSKIIGAMTDVTELRLKEKLLAASESKLLNILNTVKETVFSFTYISRQKPKFNFFSKGDIGIWGYTEEELIGQQQLWYERVVEEDKTNIVQPALRKLKRLQSVEIEYRFEKPGGEIIWVSSRLNPQQINEKETLIIGTAIDITERKMMDSMILMQNEELKKTNMELDRFVYSTSHDLRAPLTSVMGLLNIFGMETSEAHHIKYIEMMRSSIHKLDQFISNIVDYSRNSRTQVTFEQVNLKEMVRESFEQLQFLTANKPIIEEYDISDNLLLVTDKTRLQMILNNLISNAIKYHKKDDTPCIIVLTAHQSVGKDSVVIRISDNGVGIPESNLAFIFDMFFTGNTQNHGSGIGLYIVKESVEKIKGRISVESVLMQGTTFEIELPCVLN